MDDQLLTNALDALERVIQAKRDELAAYERSLALMRQSSPNPEALPPPRTNEWEKVGITEAAQRWLTEVNGPRGTREIADAIRDRGVRTQSRNYTATVYATLTNAKTKFKRVDGMWALVQK